MHVYAFLFCPEDVYSECTEELQNVAALNICCQKKGEVEAPRQSKNRGAASVTSRTSLLPRSHSCNKKLDWKNKQKQQNMLFLDYVDDVFLVTYFKGCTSRHSSVTTGATLVVLHRTQRNLANIIREDNWTWLSFDQKTCSQNFSNVKCVSSPSCTASEGLAVVGWRSDVQPWVQSSRQLALQVSLQALQEYLYIQMSKCFQAQPEGVTTLSMLMDAYRSLSSRLLETRDTCETRDICTFRSVPRTSSTVSWRPATIFVFLAPVRCKVAGKCHENASRF